MVTAFERADPEVRRLLAQHIEAIVPDPRSGAACGGGRCNTALNR